MNSFILIAKDKTKRTALIQSFAKEKGIGKFDVHFFEPQENSFGISDVRSLQKAAFIKPIQSKEKMLVLEKSESLTIEAQNALLKLLEEPPGNTYIFLSTISDAPFLPTILSRCKTIVLEETTEKVSDEDKKILLEQLHLLQKGSEGEKLALAEKLSQEKETLPAWFDNIILETRQQMIADPSNPLHVFLLQNFQQARTLFQTTNVAPRMILEHCFLSL